MPVLELDHHVQGVNIREVLLANRILLEIIIKHEHNPCYLFPTKEVHNFGHFFDDADTIVFEVSMSKFVIAQDPKRANYVIRNLWRRGIARIYAWPLKKIIKDFEA